MRRSLYLAFPALILPTCAGFFAIVKTENGLAASTMTALAR
jgi:hypothetical protein